MKKIAIFRPRWAKNNTAYETQARMYHYLQKNFNLTVTVFADRENKFSFDGLEVVHVDNYYKPGLIRSMRKKLGLQQFDYRQIELLSGYDVIETSDPTVYEWTYTAWKAAQRYGAHLSCGSSITDMNNVSINLRRAKKIMSSTDTIWCCTEKARERFDCLGLLKKSSDKSFILGHAIDTHLFCPAANKNNKVLKLLSLGHINENKGHMHILFAVAKLIKSGFLVEWNIVGFGSKEDSLREQIDLLGLEKYVRFLGVINNTDLPAVYAKADIFILHQLYQETFGLALAEAMSCGIPVIASTVGGIPLVVLHNRTGILVSPEDAEGLFLALQRLCCNKDVRNEMAIAARQHILNNFSLELVAQRSLRAWGLEHLL